MSDEDEDRAAILRRRRRFIALAMSGLTSAAGCDEAPPPAEPPAQERPLEAAEEGEPSDDEEAPMEPADAVDEDDEALFAEAPIDDGPPDQAEVRHAEDQKRRWQRRAHPVPCLTRLGPMVCLSVAPQPQPTVCLSPWKPGDPDDEQS